MCITTGKNTDTNVEPNGVLVASTDIPDADNRTIVLKYMPDGTIAIDCDNDPELVERYKDQIDAILKENAGSLVRPMPKLPSMAAMFAGLGLGKAFTAEHVLGRLNTRNYGPCIDCGNPAKGGHCFKCQQKRKAT
jgi:hypothetical protein